MDEQKQSLIDRIKQAQNILVTVSTNPSVDQLSAAIGLTLALNKIDKHGTAVFSGQVPSTIEFLKPEDTLEKNTDSLRDFIIALDKAKADKLRYKVEDEVVRIFITPYRTSISEKDLQFSQGDFNVDVVVALGVSEQKDLDSAITAHGRILHDATVASISNAGQNDLGTLNWVDPGASSLCEMVTMLVDGLDKKAMDNQIATALLTGIVANTERFSNDKTTPKTMSASAELMAAGANQKLIASELDNPSAPASSGPSTDDTAPEGDGPKVTQDPGTLEIRHQDGAEEPEEPAEPAEEPEPEEQGPQVHVDEDGQLVVDDDGQFPEISRVRGVGSDGTPTEGGNEPKRERMTEPPKFSDADLTANTEPEDEESELPTEQLVQPAMSDLPLLTHNEHNLDDDSKGDAKEKGKSRGKGKDKNKEDEEVPPSIMLPPLPPAPEPAPAPASDFKLPAPSLTPSATPAPAAPASDPGLSADLFAAPQTDDVPAVSDDTTLADIESSVHSPHVLQAGPVPTADVDSARDAVEAALNSAPAAVPMTDPIAALNAQPLGDTLHETVSPAPAVPNAGFNEPTPGSTPDSDALDMPLPSNPFGPGQQVTPAAPPSTLPGMPPPPGGQTPPPPVPPPMLPPIQ